MSNEWISFIDVLHERGRRCGYKSTSEKQSDKLTIREQEELSGYLLKTMCEVEASRAVTYNMDYKRLADNMISNEVNIDNIISENIVGYFYTTIDEMLQERNSHMEYIPPMPLSDRVIHLGE